MTAKLCSAELALNWQQLPPLPDPIGFAGAFAGASDGALIVAGGANFPDKMPWEGGTKIWYDKVFVLDKPDGVWRGGFALPQPAGYGVSVTAKDGVVCIGGSDAKRHLMNVFLLRWQRGRLAAQELPPLPLPVANSCGALVGTSIYIAGGTETPESTHTLKKFLRLDLAKKSALWEELDPWPGPARMLSVAASLEGDFFLATGTDLSPGADGKPVRTYLKDAYRFTPGKGWKRIADPPNPVVAAPTPAPVIGKSQFLIIGGDDGTLVNFEPKSKHPGFPKRVLCYDAKLDAWSEVGETPAPRATVPTVEWNGLCVMPNGESRPGVRSPEVWAIRAVDR